MVVEALARLPKDVLHGRYARFKVALHTNMMRRELPEAQWPKPEEVSSVFGVCHNLILRTMHDRSSHDPVSPFKFHNTTLFRTAPT